MDSPTDASDARGNTNKPIVFSVMREKDSNLLALAAGEVQPYDILAFVRREKELQKTERAATTAAKS